MAAAERAVAAAEPYPLPGFAHQYRHPKRPGEAWRRVAGATSPTGPVHATARSDREAQ
jgi:hypothetical protein